MNEAFDAGLRGFQPKLLQEISRQSRLCGKILIANDFKPLSHTLLNRSRFSCAMRQWC